jgi:aminoglycoside 3-N-acetyltransferase I
MMPSLEIRRLAGGDVALARTTFALMVEVFDEADAAPLGEPYVARLLARDDFWAFAALIDGRPVGGLTAHVLPMTRAESTELFIYDLAVRASHQRQGIGRALVDATLAAARDAGIASVFVPADNEDVHALDFYRAIGGDEAPVTFFTFE